MHGACQVGARSCQGKRRFEESGDGNCEHHRAAPPGGRFRGVRFPKVIRHLDLLGRGGREKPKFCRTRATPGRHPRDVLLSALPFMDAPNQGQGSGRIPTRGWSSATQGRTRAPAILGAAETGRREVHAGARTTKVLRGGQNLSRNVGVYWDSPLHSDRDAGEVRSGMGWKSNQGLEGKPFYGAPQVGRSSCKVVRFGLEARTSYPWVLKFLGLPKFWDYSVAFCDIYACCSHFGSYFHVLIVERGPIRGSLVSLTGQVSDRRQEEEGKKRMAENADNDFEEPRSSPRGSQSGRG